MENVYYHYTTEEGFYNIIESDYLCLSKINYFSDAADGLHFHYFFKKYSRDRQETQEINLLQ